MIRKGVLLLVIFLLFFNLWQITTLHGQRLEPTPDSKLQQLKVEISTILKETGTPGGGIAIVTRSGKIFSQGFGKADVGKNINANDGTIFRCASVSKMITTLCVLELEREGQLSLQDELHSIAPEVKFQNAWENSNPVKIIHLLSHTTGWDDIHSPEIAHNDSVPIPLKIALDFHPHSRVCRWVPGTRKAYSNSGYGVAAYLVEKISGVTFEEYATLKILQPLRMTRTTFYNDILFRKYAAVQYDRNLRVLPYRNVIYRAAGAMNSTPNDMANLIEFLLNRGTFKGDELLSDEVVRKMEEPQGTAAARVGLQLGYGLGNETTLYKGFVYHGHGGTLDGGLCEVAYLPEHGIGHVIFINASKPEAFIRISQLIRDFEVGLFRKDSTSTFTSPNTIFTFDDGYYVPINPRNQSMLFMDYLIGIERVERVGNVVTKSWIFTPEQKQKYLASSDSTFAVAGTSKVGMVKIIDPLAGQVLYFDNLVMKKIPGSVVVIQLTLLVLWIISGLASIVLWVCHRFLPFFKSTGSGKSFSVYNFPTLTSALYLALLIMLKLGFADYDNNIATPSAISFAITLISVLTIPTVMMSGVAIYRNRHLPKTSLYIPIVLVVLHALGTGYLLSFEAIPIITWR